MEFNDSHKQEYQRRVPFGVSKVQITGVVLDKTESGQEFVEVGFITADGLEDSARVWFTTDKAAQFSFNTLRDILIHNQKEENKDKARDAMMKVPNTEAMALLLDDKLRGKEMWVLKQFDPKRTYESNGQTFRSINTNIYGYEPKVNPELMPSQDSSGASSSQANTMEDTVEEEVAKVFPGAKSVDEAMDDWGK